MPDAAVPAPPADDEPTTVSIFNEQSLRAAIASVWGEHGAHIAVFDHLLGRAGVSPQPEITDGEFAERFEEIAGPILREYIADPYDLSSAIAQLLLEVLALTERPQPEITRQQLSQVIDGASGDRLSLARLQAITDAVWARLADGATPAGPEHAAALAEFSRQRPGSPDPDYVPPEITGVGATPAGPDPYDPAELLLCPKSFALYPENHVTLVPDAEGWGACVVCGQVLNIQGKQIPQHEATREVIEGDLARPDGVGATPAEDDQPKDQP